MPFCTSCGKEVPPGKKFCEYCGTPLEQPAVAPVTSPATPAPPVFPQPVPVPVAGGSGKTLIIAGIVVLLVIIAGIYFIGLPMIAGSPATVPATPQITSSQSPVNTPIPTLVYQGTAGSSVAAGTPASSQTYEEKYTETYNQVYSTSHAFVGGQRESVPVDARNPPLYVKYNITPEIEIGEKIDEVGQMVSTSYISPTAWFKVSVYDAGNGVLLEEQGFNKGFSVMTQQEFMVRAPGTYRVEISGNNVIADVRILTGKP